MWIVYVNGKRHSAWLNQADAVHQVHVLRDHGYKGLDYCYDDTTSCEDGHYYV